MSRNRIYNLIHIFSILVCVNTIAFSQEINCFNEIDDDGDGFIDSFDSDCDCLHENYYAQCEIDCEVLPLVPFDFSMEIKWQSDFISNEFIFPGIVAGDINADGQADIITCTSFNDGANYNNGISIINGSNGMQANSFPYHNNPGFKDFSHMVIAKASNNDLEASIFILDNNSYTIKSFSQNGNLNWESSPLFDVQGTLLNVADFNEDGISELYIGRQIFNAESGVLLVAGTESAGCNKGVSIFDQCNFTHSIAADLLPSFGLELAAGNTVYEINITNLTGEIGNTMNPILAPFDVKDGLTSIADIDGDGFLDVINVRDINYSDGGAIWIWNPRTQQIIAQGISGQGGGIPCIGNVDGDCTPEVAVIYLNQMKVYKYNGSSTLSEMYVLNIEENSANTSPTMFDFNLDGKNEIVLRDETSLKIIEGESGVILSQIPLLAGTGNESPIIVDVDNDNQAEILTHGSLNDQNQVQLFAIETASSNWASARSIWNQVGYYVTNVNDDLSIPISPQNIAQSFETNCSSSTCPKVYNNFNVQATFRNQQGCIQYPGFDLIVEGISTSCDKDSIGIQFSIAIIGNPNSSLDSILVELFYDFPTGQNETLLKDAIYEIELIDLNSPDTLVINIPFETTNDIFISVQLLSQGLNIECDTFNNIDSLKLNFDIIDLDLGPDIIKCSQEIVILSSNESYNSYLWSDSSRDSTLSTSIEGEYILQVTDYCNNVLFDTILIQNKPSSSLGIDLEIYLCLGDSIVFEIDQYETILWEASGNFDCDDCSRVIYKTTELDTIVVTYSDGNCIYFDSIFVNLITQIEIFESIIICEGDKYEFLEEEFIEEGVYEILNSTCDSLFILDIKINEHSFTTQEFKICQNDSILIGNNWYFRDTVFTQSYKSSSGCDSLIELTIVEVSPLFTFDSISICNKDSVYYFDKWLSEEGIYLDTFSSFFGCDSIHSIHLEELRSDELDLQIEICQGDSIELGNTFYYEQGFYTVILLNELNCDSIINLEVSIPEILTDSFFYSICESDSIIINGNAIYETSELIDTIRDNSCEKIEYHIVEVLEHSIEENFYILCQGDSVLIDGDYIKEEGQVTTFLTSINGCDSIINSNIEIILYDQLYNINFDCNNSLLQINLLNTENWSVLWSDGSTDFERVLDADLNYTVELVSELNMACVNNIIIDLDSFDFDKIDFQINDEFILQGDSVIVELPIEISDWDIKWEPSNLIECDTCSKNTILIAEDTTFEIILTNRLGCEEILDFTVYIDSESNSDIYIPNIFTPNFDGNNDTWDISAMNNQIESLIIYDRWGNKVANWNGVTEINWDGTKDNEPLEIGVYVFIIKLSNELRTNFITGNVTLLK